jgi:dienelactone hydrolase
VLLHGSGSDAGTEYLYNGDFFVAHGIAALVYDKRGTGRSGGEYTFDYQQLARDAVAAVGLLRARPEIKPERIGLAGYSQGGWVAPLAASLSDDVSFVLVSYGMIESAVEEVRLETRNLLRKRGVAEESLTEVDELTLAAVHVVATDFQQGWGEFAAAKKKYKNAPWRKQLHGTPVDSFLKYPRWVVKLIGPRKAPNGLPWHYDSTELLTDLSIPMAWFLGEADESAPNELTIPRLRRLRELGKPYELILFGATDHTMLIFEVRDGERIYTGYSPGYFRSEVEHALRFVADTNSASRHE